MMRSQRVPYPPVTLKRIAVEMVYNAITLWMVRTGHGRFNAVAAAEMLHHLCLKATMLVTGKSMSNAQDVDQVKQEQLGNCVCFLVGMAMAYLVK